MSEMSIARILQIYTGRVRDMCVQGKRHEVVPKLKQDMKAILLTNWKIWIPFQFVNFNFVPQQLQVCWPVLPDTYRHSPEGLKFGHSLCSEADCMCVMCLALDRELPCNLMTIGMSSLMSSLGMYNCSLASLGTDTCPQCAMIQHRQRRKC